MPGAGFYSIHTDELKFASDGRWYADGEPIEHARLANLFSRHLRRKPSGGYEIWIDAQYHADVRVEDTMFVVVGVDLADDTGATIQLNDGSSEPLAAETLETGADDVLYCRVKCASERARFLRSAYNHLAPHIEGIDAESFALRIGSRLYPIRNHR